MTKNVLNEALEEAHEKLEEEKDKVVNLSLVRKGMGDSTSTTDWLSKVEVDTVLLVLDSSNSSNYLVEVVIVVDKITTTVTKLYIEDKDIYILVYNSIYSSIYSNIGSLGKQSDKVSLTVDDATAAEDFVKETSDAY